MSMKRSNIDIFENKGKRSKNENSSVIFFHKTLKECGLVLKSHPEKCVALEETASIIFKLRKKIMKHRVSSRNTEIFFEGFKCDCNDPKTFEQYLEPINHLLNSDHCDSVITVLLNITTLQSELIKYVFNKILVMRNQLNFDNLVKNILKAFNSVDVIENYVESNKIIELLDEPMDETIKQEVISAIPDIVGEFEHYKIASELITMLYNNSELLISSILDCITYLSLTDTQFAELQMKTLEAMHVRNASCVPICVQFLLTPGRLSDSAFEKIIMALRESPQWPTLFDSEQASNCNQPSIPKAIRNSMISSKATSKVWLKVITNCEVNKDYKQIDIILFLILFSISDEMQNIVKKEMKTQIILGILNEDLLEKVFKNFKQIFSDNIRNLICLSNALLENSTEPLVQSYITHMYTVMFMELKDHSRAIIDGLFQLILNFKQSILIAVNILNNIASKNLHHLESQSHQIFTLLEDIDDLTLTEIRAIKNLVCGLAFNYRNFMTKNKVYININKQLGSCIPSIKIRGILAGIYAVKYLMKDNTDFIVPDNVTMSMTFPDGDLSEAADIIERITHSTRYFPDMTVFFYEELSKIIQNATIINAGFIECLISVFSKEWERNFLLNTNNIKRYDEIRVTQVPANENFDDEIELVVNIAGIILEDNKNISIDILSPLFKLVGMLHLKKENGDLSSVSKILEYSFALPVLDIESIGDLSDISVAKILDCYIHCVNFIREMLNVFATQKDEKIIAQIFKRSHQLREQENVIGKILLQENITYQPPTYYSYAYMKLEVKGQAKIQRKEKQFELYDLTLPESSKVQPTKTDTTPKNKHANTGIIHFRPLNINLIELLRFDLKSNGHNTELTFEILNYLLEHINGALEKILLPNIKRKMFSNDNNKDDERRACKELYSTLEAEIQAKIVSGILPKLMDHIDVIMNFLNGHIEDDVVNFDSEHASNIIQSSSCLERIYNLLFIYFQWFEFKERHVPLLTTSIKTIANVTNGDSSCIEYLLTTVTENFKKQEKYCITQTSAVSLIKLVWALTEHSKSSETSIIKDLAHSFLSKQWKTPDDELEQGEIYDQGLIILTKLYFSNNKLIELKNCAASLVNDVDKLRENTSVLNMFKSLNKTNFYILFTNLGFSLYDKIKVFLKATFKKDEDIVVMWENVATILKLMSNIATTLKSKCLISYSNIFNKILQIFITKGFSILKTQLQQRRMLVEKVLKDFETSAKCLKSALQSAGGERMKKRNSLRTNLTCLSYKTKRLIGATKQYNSTKKTRKNANEFACGIDDTMQDSDNDLPDDEYEPDESAYSSDASQNDYLSQCV